MGFDNVGSMLLFLRAVLNMIVPNIYVNGSQEIGKLGYSDDSFSILFTFVLVVSSILHVGPLFGHVAALLDAHGPCTSWVPQS